MSRGFVLAAGGEVAALTRCPFLQPPDCQDNDDDVRHGTLLIPSGACNQVRTRIAKPTTRSSYGLTLRCQAKLISTPLHVSIDQLGESAAPTQRSMQLRRGLASTVDVAQRPNKQLSRRHCALALLTGVVVYRACPGP